MSSLPMTLVRSLHFGEDRSGLLKTIRPEGWPQLLSLADEAHVGIVLAQRCLHVAPSPFREQLESRLRRNAARHARVLAAHEEIAGAMESRGAQFLVLKGLTHDELWHGEAGYRPQYDIDLYCPPASIGAAREAAASIGYEPAWDEDNGADHIPTLVRRTGWRWRGDYYDREQPLALELHHRFATPGLGFRADGEELFWNRRTTGVFGGIQLPALCAADRVTYAAWHAVRHLLGGNLRVSHIYEMAHFLHHTAQDEEFWRRWSGAGAPGSRLAEPIAFRLAQEWFGCSVNAVVEEHIQALPHNVDRWFGMFGFSPIDAIARPNKDELFLNLCLAQSAGDRGRIVLRRVFPTRMPPTRLDAHLPSESPQLRLRRGLFRAGFMARRGVHHLRTLAPLVRSTLRWWASPTPR